MRSGFGVNESESDACVRCACNVFVCSNSGLLYCTQNAPFEAYCGAYYVLNIGADHLILFIVAVELQGKKSIRPNKTNNDNNKSG